MKREHAALQASSLIIHTYINTQHLIPCVCGSVCLLGDFICARRLQNNISIQCCVSDDDSR